MWLLWSEIPPQTSYLYVVLWYNEHWQPLNVNKILWSTVDWVNVNSVISAMFCFTNYVHFVSESKRGKRPGLTLGFGLAESKGGWETRLSERNTIWASSGFLTHNLNCQPPLAPHHASECIKTSELPLKRPVKGPGCLQLSVCLGRAMYLNCSPRTVTQS